MPLLVLITAGGLNFSQLPDRSQVPYFHFVNTSMNFIVDIDI